MTSNDHLASLQPFVEAKVLAAADVFFAEMLDEALGSARVKHRGDVLLAAALASRAPRHGHVCADLRSVEQTVAVDSRDPDVLELLSWPHPERWLTALQQSSLGPILKQGEALDLGDLDDHERPLVLSNGLLYLHRYHTYEKRTLDRLSERHSVAATEPSPALVAALHELLPAGLQRDAAGHALTKRLSVLAGGPGTGKTYTLARMLAALYMSQDPDDPPISVGLAAPTGKAAARMTESIRLAASELELSGPVSERLTEKTALTIHRMLGFVDGIRFRHDAQNPLSHDVVVVDEVSMVSLPLMARLLDALRPDARIVLVGDPFQLASVEAGAVLGEITQGIPDAVVELQQARRYDEDSGISELATAVKQGDADAAIELLGSSSDLELLDPESDQARASVLSSLAETGAEVLDAARQSDAAAAIAASARRKILCGTRHGPNGVWAWQRDIERAVLADRTDRLAKGRWYVGRPVMVTANDYLLNLFNGDTGVVIAGEHGQRQLVFDAAPDAEKFDPSQLGELDTWWAMTIHKSQGSEFEHVIIGLPVDRSPVLTRELLYTGITRAKSKVTLLATAESVRQAIDNPVRRSSGLATALSG